MKKLLKMKNEKVAKGRIIGLAGPCSFIEVAVNLSARDVNKIENRAANLRMDDRKDNRLSGRIPRCNMWGFLLRKPESMFYFGCHEPTVLVGLTQYMSTC